MIKVALLIPTLDRSGAEKQLTLLACGLPSDEFDVQVVTLTRGGPYEEQLRKNGIPVTHLNKRFKFDPVALYRLRRYLARTQPDVLHSWLFTANAYGRMVVGGKRRPKMLVSERCVDSWKSSWQRSVDSALQSRTDLLVANSLSVKEHYATQGFPPEKIQVIPNGVEIPPPAWELTEDEKFRFRQEFDIPSGARVVGYVGRLARQKRVNVLVWATQLLRQLTENVYFLIVGEGPERHDLLQLAQHMKLDHLLRFAGQRNDSARLIRGLDVFWLASEFEGMSNSLMEAMAAGVPVVVSDIPPNRELVTDGESGFVVAAEDSVGFAQFADRILADPALGRRLGEAARHRMIEHHGVEKMVHAYADVYRSLVKEPVAHTSMPIS